MSFCIEYLFFMGIRTFYQLLFPKSIKKSKKNFQHFSKFIRKELPAAPSAQKNFQQFRLKNRTNPSTKPFS